jgi:hypothetical protein
MKLKKIISRYIIILHEIIDMPDSSFDRFLFLKY